MVRRLASLILLLFLCFALPPRAEAYSLLTHEQLIDLTWQSAIVPLLLSRYPHLTPAQIEHARAYAYGGCVIQDIGYYPFGDANFSNLTHYVRSGDFVVNLFRNAGNADELAFAVGALSHYIGDTIGHATATNLAVPVEFPGLGQRYGAVVNYAQGEHEHVQTEFAFDINEIAHHRFAPVHYLRHVGLEVPTRQLALAFYQTYGLREDFTAHRGHRINVGGYRFAVRDFIPRVAYAVTFLRRKHKLPDNLQDPDFQRLDREVSAVAQQNGWKGYRRDAGIGTYCLAGIIYVLPKVGPLKLVSVQGPTPATEREYLHSVILSTDALTRALRRFSPPPAQVSTAALASASDPHADKSFSATVPTLALAAEGVPNAATNRQHPLVNRDLDTGDPVEPSGYPLTDATYAQLLHRLAATPANAVPPGIKSDILAYYSRLDLPFATKRNPSAWAAVLVELGRLRTMPTSTNPLPYPTYGDGDENTGPADASTVIPAS